MRYTSMQDQKDWIIVLNIIKIINEYNQYFTL